MNLFSIPKDTAVQLAGFAKKHFIVWLRVVGNPLAVVSKVNLRSRSAVMPAVRFVAFVYGVTLLVALPKMFLFQNVAVSNQLVILSDFVATALGFCLVGLTLYASGKLMGGRGRLLGSMIGGFYLTALWPIVQATDYLLSPELPRELDPRWTMVVHAALLVLIALFVVALIIAKASPVMAYIHAIGTLRATIAVMVQLLLVFVGLFLFLRPLFERLAGKQ